MALQDKRWHFWLAWGWAGWFSDGKIAWEFIRAGLYGAGGGHDWLALALELFVFGFRFYGNLGFLAYGEWGAVGACGGGGWHGWVIWIAAL